MESGFMSLNEWCNCENDSNDVKVATRSLANKVSSIREARKQFDKKGKFDSNLID